MSIVVGIDVGLTGAVAFLDSSRQVLLDVIDMPVDRIAVNDSKDRGRVSDVRLLAILAGARGAHAFIEEPEGRPIAFRDKATGQRMARQPGAAGMLSLGTSYGIARCACTASGLVLTNVRPGAWKRSLGISGSKDDSRRRAAELFPDFAHMFALKKSDGRAEAALIALWGARQIMGRTAA